MEICRPIRLNPSFFKSTMSVLKFGKLLSVKPFLTRERKACCNPFAVSPNFLGERDVKNAKVVKGLTHENNWLFSSCASKEFIKPNLVILTVDIRE